MIVKEIVRKTSGEIDLSEAKIVVAGGRGVKSKKRFKLIRESAEIGTVGASQGN